MSITDELREWGRATLMPSLLNPLFAIADRIDAEHEKALSEAYTKGCEDGVGVANAKYAQAEYLRGKNDGYDEGWDAGFASADDWLAQHEDAMAEHGWVRKNKEHVVAHAAIEVTPRIDWSHMADELDVFTQLVRGFAEQVEEDA